MNEKRISQFKSIKERIELAELSGEPIVLIVADTHAQKDGAICERTQLYSATDSSYTAFGMIQNVAIKIRKGQY